MVLLCNGIGGRPPWALRKNSAVSHSHSTNLPLLLDAVISGYFGAQDLLKEKAEAKEPII